MVSIDKHFSITKPSKLLGFLFSATIILGITTFAFQFIEKPHPLVQFFVIPKESRIVFWAAYFAFFATFLGALIAASNTVRQHTINTILQSRLSDIFIQKGASLSSSLKRFKDQTEEPKKDKYTFIDVEDLKYVLNFYEYVAIGVRYGDLEEKVMRDTLRSVVLNLCEEFKEYIAERQAENPRLYINLTRLKDKWNQEKQEEDSIRENLIEKCKSPKDLSASEILICMKNKINIREVIYGFPE